MTYKEVENFIYYLQDKVEAGYKEKVKIAIERFLEEIEC